MIDSAPDNYHCQRLKGFWGRNILILVSQNCKFNFHVLKKVFDFFNATKKKEVSHPGESASSDLSIHQMWIF